MSTSLPHVRVLMATYNGSTWLDTQLQSIFDQKYVRVSIVVSDDASTDATPACLSGWTARNNLMLLPRPDTRLGSANRNFLRLIREAPLDDAEFIALADQDDVWLPTKIARAIHCLTEIPADAYSSDVTAFWPDGEQLLIKKSQPQRTHDYLFGSPGPGCTFVMPRAVFDQMRDWVIKSFKQMQEIWVHDWLIYAYVRSNGLRWHIDDQPNMLYRQHGRNEIGVNIGWSAARNRLQRVRSGEYRRNVLAIADLVGHNSNVLGILRRLSPLDRLVLIMKVRSFRRRLSECITLALFFLIMPR